MKNGRTKVRVMREELNEQNGKTTLKEIHTGTVVQQTTTHVRVYSSKRSDEGGDASQASSEWFPIKAKRSWVEVVGELLKPIELDPVLT